MRQVDFAGLAKVLGVNYQLVVGSGLGSYPAIEINGGGHHIAVVVVSMLADQIDAAGGAVDAGIGSKLSAKSLG